MTASVSFRGVRRVHADDDGAEAVALDGVDLTVAGGELVAVTGPSGSGKSTLLHLAGALDLPDAGAVAIDGVDIAGLDGAGRARLRNRSIGFVFQAFHLAPGLTIAENVALPAVVAKVPVRTFRRRVDELLDLVDLSGKAGRRPAQLSGGEQQRAAVARALVMDPAIVLADEPTGNLDSRAGALVVDLLLAAHRAGRTVVLATHDQRLAARAERIVRLRDGRIVDETKPSRRADRDAPALLDVRPA